MGSPNSGWQSMWTVAVTLIDSRLPHLDQKAARLAWGAAVLGRDLATWSQMPAVDVARLWWAAHGWEFAVQLIETQTSDGVPDEDAEIGWESDLWSFGFPSDLVEDWHTWLKETRSPFPFGTESVRYAAKGAKMGHLLGPHSETYELWPHSV